MLYEQTRQHISSQSGIGSPGDEKICGYKIISMHWINHEQDNKQPNWCEDQDKTGLSTQHSQHSPIQTLLLGPLGHQES